MGVTDELKSPAMKRVSRAGTCLTHLASDLRTAALSCLLACTVLAGDQTC